MPYGTPQRDKNLGGGPSEGQVRDEWYWETQIQGKFSPKFEDGPEWPIRHWAPTPYRLAASTQIR